MSGFGRDLIESLNEAVAHANGGSMTNSRERIVDVSAKGVSADKAPPSRK